MESICGRCVQCTGAGAGIIIITLERIRVEHSFRLGFKASKNEVEYEALIVGLRVVLIRVPRKWRFTQILDWWLTRCRVALKPRILG